MTDERILSTDFATANQALAESIKNRDARLVRLALDHPALEIKRQAAAALGQLGDSSCVPNLIDVLERNQAVQRGGSETLVLQTELNAAVIAALQKLTGVDFGAADASSPEDVRRALETSRQWWQENQK
jgi:HEAT repeat protein